jgi:hypothetical protein
MGTQQNAENARATREAAEALVHRALGRDPLAVDAALRRYLAAEQYAREQHSGERADEEDRADR